MTKLVGILNVTPDSFSDGNLYLETDKALKHANSLFSDGAYIVDIGAESTRPGAIPISSVEEGERVGALLTELIKLHPSRGYPLTPIIQKLLKWL